MIKGTILDVDNTLTDFMSTRRVDAAVEMMPETGPKISKSEMVDVIREDNLGGNRMRTIVSASVKGG